MSATRIVIADDSVLVRAGVEALLSIEPGHEIVGIAGSLPELVEVVDQVSPDLVITDVRMPPTRVDEGIEAANRFRTSHPDVGVLVLSQFADPAYLRRLVDGGSGRRGYLLKDNLATPGELVTAIDLIHPRAASRRLGSSSWALRPSIRGDGARNDEAPHHCCAWRGCVGHVPVRPSTVGDLFPPEILHSICDGVAEQQCEIRVRDLSSRRARQ